MTLAQVKNYFAQIDRTCRGRLYTKQWRVSRTRINGCTLREYDYPVQWMFFDTLHEVA